MLRKIRIGVSVVLLALITLYFLDFAELLPFELKILEEIQLLPALLALNVGVLVSLTVLTFVFGRVYCSSICPLGVYQDLVSWLGKRTFFLPDKKSGGGKKAGGERKKRKSGRKRYRYLEPANWLRYGFLALTILGFVAGLHVLVGLLDPYSAFGRMTVHLFKPVYQAGNNLMFSIFNSFGNHTFYKIAIYMLSISSLVIALVTLAIVSILAWRNGRIYCNTVCPVGTTLGLISRFSLFQIRFDSSACTLCGSCARSCKSSCIDFKQMKVDSSRCVACFDCVDVCKEAGLHFRMPRKGERTLVEGNKIQIEGKGAPIEGDITPNSGKRTHTESNRALKENNSVYCDIKKGSGARFYNARQQPAMRMAGHADGASRRRFLTALGITGLAATRMAADKLLKVEGSSSGMKYVPELGIELGPKRDVARTKPIMPPGAFNFERFTEKCTSCHLCVAKCPAQVIKPAFLDYGLGGMFQPMMNFDNHFCNYDCTICSDVCPTDALLPLSKDDKHHNQMGVVQLYLENCIVYTDETSCGACSEHCPTQAVHMVAYKGSLTIPKIEQAICVGCGGCEYVCPAKPWKAIFVEGKSTHERIELEFEEVEESTVDDFGF